MNRNLLFLTIIMVSITVVPLRGEEEESSTLQLTLDDAVSYAIKNNIDLKTSYLDLDAKRRSYQNKWNYFLPQISFSTRLNRSSSDPPGITDPSESELWNLSGSLSATLPLNIGISNGVTALRLTYEAGLIDNDSVVKQLENAVKKQFYLLLTLKENLIFLEANLELAQKRYRQSLLSYQNGLTSELDLLQAEVNAKSQEPRLENARNEYSKYLEDFKIILGFGLETEINIVGVLEPEFYTFDTDKLINSYITKRHDVRAKAKEMEIAENTKNLHFFNEKTPAFTISTGVDSGVASPFSGDSWDSDTITKNWSLSFSLSVPLDTLIPYSQGDLKVKDAESFRQMAEWAYVLTTDKAKSEIQNLVNTLETSQNNLELSILTADVAQRSYEMMEEAYNQGIKELLDVETSQANLLEANQEVLTTMYSYISAIIDLEYAINTAIDEAVKE